MTDTTQTTPEDTKGAAGPALTGLVSAAAFVGIIFVSGLLFTGAIPRPDASPAETGRFFTDNASVIRAGALVRVAASALLIAFCTVAATRMRRIAPSSSAAGAVVVAGAVMTAVLGTLSVLFAIALTEVGAGDAPAVTEALRRLNFLTGGAGYTVWLGLVVGPLCLVLGRARALPGWLSAAGLVSATLALLSALSLVLAPAMLFIPLGRFSALLVIAAVSVLLASGRVRREGHPRSRPNALAGGAGAVLVAIAVTVLI